jgi:hypothetical protein
MNVKFRVWNLLFFLADRDFDIGVVVSKEGFYLM